MNRSRRLALALCAFALGACDEATAPDGTSSDATVHVYVDADGSGGLSDEDVFVQGAQITLTPQGGGQALTGTTNASGLAAFELEPGSYTVTMTGNAPEGAVLATASAPVLVAPFQGDSIAQEFRFVFNPGSVQGRLFRDNNNNDVFDAGDTPAPGIPVALFAGSSAEGDPIATTTTDANGQFTFVTLRPGTYTYSFTPLPTMTVTGGNSVTVTVGADAATAAPVEFTGNLISAIDDIRSLAAGSSVAFEGVVTVGNGVLSGSQFYVQDNSGSGILVFGTLPTPTQLGDSVRVIGTIGGFSGETQITNPTVVKIGTGTVPAPRVQTVEQVLTGDTEGMLVRTGNVTVLSVSGGPTSTAYNVVVENGEGTELTIRVAAAAVGIPQTFWQVGRSYDVTGLVSRFNGVPQIKPRSATDVELRSNATPIGTVRAMAFADSAGTRRDTVTIEGVITVAQRTFGSTSATSQSAYVQDPTGGVLLFGVPADANLIVGDSVRVTGIIDWFSGELEVARVSSTSLLQIEKLGTGITPSPRSISGAQFTSRAFEGQLVRLANVRVDSIGGLSGNGGYTVWVITGDRARVEVRIENTAIGIPASSWTVGSIVNIVGALSRFGGVATQVKPRSAADVTAGTADILTIAAAEQRPEDETVTVEGVVTAPVGPFGTANAYIDDGTAGIQIFGVPTDVTLAVGDLIRVRGKIDVFSGEVQVARFSSTDLLQITKLGTAATPLPRLVTGAQIVARTFEGELVRVENAVVVSIGTVSGSGGYNVTLRAADGTEFVFRNDRAAVGIPVSTFVVGNTYDVTGVLTVFSNAAQMKGRSAADVTAR